MASEEQRAAIQASIDAALGAGEHEMDRAFADAAQSLLDGRQPADLVAELITKRARTRAERMLLLALAERAGNRDLVRSLLSDHEARMGTLWINGVRIGPPEREGPLMDVEEAIANINERPHIVDPRFGGLLADCFLLILTKTSSTV